MWLVLAGVNSGVTDFKMGNYMYAQHGLVDGSAPSAMKYDPST